MFLATGEDLDVRPTFSTPKSTDTKLDRLHSEISRSRDIARLIQYTGQDVLRDIDAPLIVTDRQYAHITNMSREQLLKLHPELELAGNVARSELVFYASRGKFFSNKLLDERVERWKRFKQYTIIGQSLSLNLYDTRKNYALSSPNYLEQYIDTVDNILNDKVAMINLAIRLGLNIKVGDNRGIAVSLVEEMIYLIDAYRTDVTILDAINQKDDKVSPEYYSRSTDHVEKEKSTLWF